MRAFAIAKIQVFLFFAKSTLQDLRILVFFNVVSFIIKFTGKILRLSEFNVSFARTKIESAISMKIKLFNPEHDMALASGLVKFTAPRAGRLLRNDLCFLPAIWAKEDEAVLVDDVDYAWKQYKSTGLNKPCNFIDYNELSRIVSFNKALDIEPWGWDLPVRDFLLRRGVPMSSLPDNDYLDAIKKISHRGWSANNLLPLITKIENTIGKAEIGYNLKDLKSFLSIYHRVIIKSPWSCSGRGLRFIEKTSSMQLEGWLNNIIKQQGCILMEPYYEKIIDFGMEFACDGKGEIEYRGLSLFKTSNGAYIGNIIADENTKEGIIAKYFQLSLLHEIRQTVINILTPLLANTYRGPFGIDMMVVNYDGKILVHPCVELNLRMTMGHVTLAINEAIYHLMSIVYQQGKYNLKLT